MRVDGDGQPMIAAWSAAAFAQDASVRVTEVVLSADGFYVDARYGRSECIVQRARAPLPDAAVAPRIPRPPAVGPGAKRRELQVDVWWWDDGAGAGGVFTDGLAIRHGRLAGELELLRVSVLRDCDLDLLTEDELAAMPRRGARAARGVLAAR